MNAGQANSLRNSFKEIEKNGHEAGITFYQELFASNPEYKTLFHHDMHAQVDKFISTLKLIVHSFEDNGNGEFTISDELATPLRNLGKSHVEHGITTEMYAPVGDALLSALEKHLGPLFTEELRSIWLEAYHEIARRMNPAVPV